MGKRRLLMDILSNLVAFLLIFNIFVLVYAMLNNRMPWIYLLLAIPFYFVFWIRTKIKKMLPFMAIHAALLVASFAALGNIRVFVPLLGFAIVSVIYSIHTKGKGEWSMPGVTAAWVVGVFAALSLLFAAYVPDLDGVGALLNVSSLVSLAAIVLYMHLDNMRFSLAVLKEHQKKSAETSSTSNFLITVFLIMILVFGALSVLFPSEAAVLIIGRLFLEIITLPIHLLALAAQLFSREVDVYGTLPAILMFEGGMAEVEATDERSLIYSIMNTVITALAMLAILAMATAAIVTLFYRLYKTFGKKDSDSGKQSLMPEDVKSKLKFVLGDVKELLPRFKLGVKHPVRRAYIKKINGHIKKGFKALPHYTPEVIADKIRPTEDIDELTQKYEEVRYGKG